MGINRPNMAPDETRCSDAGANSRRNRRISRRDRGTRATIEILEDTGDTMVFDCFDLSAVGVFLHSDYLLSPGEMVQMKIKLPSRLRPVDVMGEVVRAQADEDGLGPGMGVAFREITRPEQSELERFLMRRFLGHG